jgi:hypothetical protein
MVAHTQAAQAALLLAVVLAVEAGVLLLHL